MQGPDKPESSFVSATSRSYKEHGDYTDTTVPILSETGFTETLVSRQTQEFAHTMARQLISDTNRIVSFKESPQLISFSSDTGNASAALTDCDTTIEKIINKEPNCSGIVDSNPELDSEQQQRCHQIDPSLSQESEKADEEQEEGEGKRVEEERETPEESQQSQSKQATDMEFTKNYSDDLLGHGGGQSSAIEADLAEFELTSNAESDPSIQEPKKRKSSSSAACTSGSDIAVSPPNLQAVKNVILSSFTQFSDVFYWKHPIESGIIFASGLALLIALMYFSIISVIAYTALGVISASGSMRLYRAVMNALNMSAATPLDHIWENFSSSNVSISTERAHELVDSSLSHINSSALYFKSVFLVEDKKATLKVGLFLYALTCIGSWFNGMTFIMIGYLSLFTLPIFYEQYKAQIDTYMNLASKQISLIFSEAVKKIASFKSQTNKDK